MMKNRFLKLLLFLFALLLAFSSCKEEYEDTKDAGNNLLEANKNEAGVVVTASGLQYKVIYNNPYGIYPRLNGYLQITRACYFIDGSTYQEEATYLDTYTSMPAGMQEAVRKMRIGSKWRIWVPVSWPVQGNVILDYSMDSTIYFPTLDQYKCNPALIIQGDVSEPVAAPAEAQVTEVGSNEEIGNYVVLDLGSGYTAVCGQLKDVQVAQKQYVAKDTILGYVAEPTKYYSIEGNNVYFELMHDGEPVDALDYLE